MNPDTSGISCCFDRRTDRMLRTYRRRGLGRTASAVLDYVAGSDLKGAETLELGSGVGGLTVAMAKAGAASCLGIDLSAQMVAAAARLATETGVAERVAFQQGDGATATLAPVDIVVLDAVICCYPDPARLLANTCGAARRAYILTIPDDRELLTRVIRMLLPLQGLVLGSGFRFYVHPADEIIETVERLGLWKALDSRIGLGWRLLAFRLPGCGAPGTSRTSTPP
jgi:SAM-dependent methyltransferase